MEAGWVLQAKMGGDAASTAVMFDTGMFTILIDIPGRPNLPTE